MNECFWSQVAAGHPLGCWEWRGSMQTNGYGRFGKNKTPAHRFAFMELRGPILEGHQIDHLCRNPVCVNPDHLEPVTPRENIKRGYSPSSKAMGATRCRHGHRFTPDNTYVTSEGKRHCKQCHRDREHRRKGLTHGSAGLRCLDRYAKHWFGSSPTCRRDGCDAPQPRKGRIAWQVPDTEGASR